MIAIVIFHLNHLDFVLFKLFAFSFFFFPSLLVGATLRGRQSSFFSLRAWEGRKSYNSHTTRPNHMNSFMPGMNIQSKQCRFIQISCVLISEVAEFDMTKTCLDFLLKGDGLEVHSPVPSVCLLLTPLFVLLQEFAVCEWWEWFHVFPKRTLKNVWLSWFSSDLLSQCSRCFFPFTEDEIVSLISIYISNRLQNHFPL